MPGGTLPGGPGRRVVRRGRGGQGGRAGLRMPPVGSGRAAGCWAGPGRPGVGGPGGVSGGARAAGFRAGFRAGGRAAPGRQGVGGARAGCMEGGRAGPERADRQWGLAPGVPAGKSNKELVVPYSTFD